MSTTCTNCTRPAELFGCNRCQSELRKMLTDLPGWLTSLNEEINGETRKGTSVRRSTDLGSPALCRLGKDGSFRGSPGQQLVYTHSVLVEWVRDLCETRGVPIPGAVRDAGARNGAYPMNTGGMALWLAENVSAIAADPGFAVAYREFKQITADIERIVDLPPASRCYGACPTVLDGNRTCGTELTLEPGAKSVQCPGCHAVRTVDELTTLRLADPYALYTASQVLLIMESDHVREPIPERTWRRWRAMKHVTPAGELYGEPAYRIQDVREFRKKWTRKAS